MLKIGDRVLFRYAGRIVDGKRMLEECRAVVLGLGEDERVDLAVQWPADELTDLPLGHPWALVGGRKYQVHKELCYPQYQAGIAPWSDERPAIGGWLGTS